MKREAVKQELATAIAERQQAEMRLEHTKRHVFEPLHRINRENNFIKIAEDVLSGRKFVNGNAH